MRRQAISRRNFAILSVIILLTSGSNRRYMWHPMAKPRHLALGKLPRGGDRFGISASSPAKLPRRQGLQGAEAQQLGGRQGRVQPFQGAAPLPARPLHHGLETGGDGGPQLLGAAGPGQRAASFLSFSIGSVGRACHSASGRPVASNTSKARSARCGSVGRRRDGGLADRARPTGRARRSTPMSSSSARACVADFIGECGRDIGQPLRAP